MTVEEYLADRTFRTGDRFTIEGAPYILVTVNQGDDGSMAVTMIGLGDGNRWSEPFVVKDHYHITGAELLELTGTAADILQAEYTPQGSLTK